jgi:ribosomal peptide maturation radical SAM protein 1
MDVALVSMPWAIFNRPSIQLAALQAYLDRELPQIRTVSLHPYLEIAAAVGLDNYRMIAENTWAAEALYCGLLFPEQKKQAAEVYRRSMRGCRTPLYSDLLLTLEQQMEQWLGNQDLTSCRLVGFTVCFSQLPSSLYAAKMVKKHYPHLHVVFGGSTCTPELGASLLTTCADIDFVITGEGERPLANLTDHLLTGAPLQPENILSRENTGLVPVSADREIPRLSDLPLPDYRNYFEQMKGVGLDFIPVLPLEFSRGCWWNKCTFCNLNLQWKGYRSKKSGQVLGELAAMIKEYQVLDFTFTDNALPPGEADRFFAATADSGLDLNFFGEIRTLKKSKTYRAYQKGGLRSVQVGIEALSDSLLKRMCKGTTVMDNLAAMKFSLAAGMVLDGNLILEFPGSTRKEVEETLTILELALPFRPLSGAGFFLGHGSPVCNNPEKYGIRSLVAHPLNRKLYPRHILDQLEMLIKSYRGDRTIQKKLWQPVRAKIREWQDFHRTRSNSALPALGYRDGGTFLVIRQELPGSRPLHHRLRGLSRKIYLTCEEPVAVTMLAEQFSGIAKDRLMAFLRDLEQKKLVYCNETSCLALAVRAPR